jgi:UDP-N-acetylmuramate dehydrogenase
MRIEENYSLRERNTFGLPVRARWFAEYADEEELRRILRDKYFRKSKFLHIGAGSNLLFLGDYNGVVLHSAIKGIALQEETADSAVLRIGAGETWDNVVAQAVSNGWYGIENLSHIPGESGAAAIQNIGAYGVEIKDVVEAVETYSGRTLKKHIFAETYCRYGYRRSRFKEPDSAAPQYIVTHIRLRLSKIPTFSLQYGHLEKEVLSHYKEITLSSVRDTVVRLRRDKLPDPAALGNAGSFFMNPVVSAERFKKLRAQYPDMPSYPAAGKAVKISAGWLIERCGFKGKSYGQVGVYEKQALILVNLGEATGNEIAAVAETIRAAVNWRFGIELAPEVQYIG